MYRAVLSGCLLSLCWIVPVTGTTLSLEPNQPPVSPAKFAQAIRPFLTQHCVECHGPTAQKGDLRLDDLSVDFSKADVRAKWQAVHERVAAGTMPPAKKPRPERAAALDFQAHIEGRLVEAERARQKVEGRVVLRRLNRIEYENTLRDLLGVTVDVKELLPADGLSHGFDNLGEALSISSAQMQRYLEAAEVALNAAIATSPRPEAKKKTYTLAEGRAGSNLGKHWHKPADGAVVVYSSGTFPSTQVDAFRAPARGRYTVRLTGYAHQSKDAVAFALYHGNFGRGGDTRLQGYHEFAPGKPTTIEVSLDMDPGDSLQPLPYGLKGFSIYRQQNPDRPDTYPGPGLALLGVEVEGPLVSEWPSRGHRLLLGDLPQRPRPGMMGKARGPILEVVSTNPQADAQRLLPGFVARAFRRPVTAADVGPYLALFSAEMKQGATFQEAMLAAATAVLCSPDFLFLREAPGRLSEHALAVRLSYFLARTLPDDDLLRLAQTAQLSQPSVLKQQVERLLRQPGAARFTTDFTDAWLNLRDIDFTTPDRQLYPEFDALLQDSMVLETRAFFDEVLHNNRSATTFLASDFAMLNGRLAQHYGIPGVSGLAIRKVPLSANSLRGGLLTQGAILKVSANGTNTSPVVRGVYVLERFLGIQPPPPPPGVPAVEPDIRGAKTVRELLDKHRSVETCAGCHRLIDPPGFALESFDVIGGYRERFRYLPEKPGAGLTVDGQRVRYQHGPAVDAAGEMTDGRRFRDFAEFRKLLLADPDRFARCLTEKLLAFATGREVGPADQPEIRRILEATRAGQHGFRDLIVAIVQSETFRNK